MKKTAHAKMIAIILAMASVLIMLPFGVFAEDSPRYDYYVALGDSVTAGGALKGYYRGVQGFLPGAYPALVKEELNCKDGFAGGLCGIRTYELLMLLDDSYEGNDYTNNFFSTERWGLPLDTAYLTNAENRARYRDAITKADLITINIGNNDIYGTYTYLSDQFLEKSKANSEAEKKAMDAVANAVASGYSPKAMNELNGALQQLGFYADLISKLSDAVQDFKVNFEKIMDYIYTNNPDADVIVIGQYNPSSAFADLFFNAENNFMEYGSRYAQRYQYVDISELGERVANGESPDNGAHPDYNGHKFIAERVCAAIAAIEHCDHSETFTLFKSKLYSGDVYCKGCGKLIQQGQFTTFSGTVIPVARNIIAMLIGNVKKAIFSIIS